MVVVVAFGRDGIFTPGTLARIDRLTRRIEEITGVEEVISLTSARFLTGAGDMIETPPVISKIPGTHEEMQELRSFVLGNELFLETLVSADGRAAAINIFVRDYPDAELIALDIDGKIIRVMEEEKGQDQLHYAGLTQTRRVMIRTMQRDLAVFVPLTMALITLVLFLTFRSVRGVVLPLLVVAASTVCTIGFIGFLDRPLSLVLTILPPLLIAIGSSYSIHVVSHFDELRRAHSGAPAA